MPPPRSTVSLICALLLATACDRPDDDAVAREQARRALQGILVHPRSTGVSVASGEEAAQLTLFTPSPVDSVAAWYRGMLRANDWTLKHEATSPDGAMVVYAKKAGRPLWITLRRNAGATGTTYTLIGAQVRGDTVR